MKMRFLHYVLLLIFIDGTLEFTVHGPTGPLVAVRGSSVVLPCYVRTPLVTERVKVEWRRTDSETLVHLFLDGESREEAQHNDYHDRAHFFTEEIQRGNFSLRLDDLRIEDNGVYRCKVYSQQDADKTLVELKVVEQLVFGSDESISASVGEEVTLNCSVDSHITPEHIEQVSWKKRDEDGDILVLLFQNNETFSYSSDERYRDRVEFFTAEIPKGNFSLRLKRVRTEDKGIYMCLMKAGDLSANATVELEKLGFSESFIVLLTLCVIASDAALLLHWLDYKWTSGDTGLCFQTFLSLGPNITMLLASIIWHFSEGSLYETVPCCAFYILGPLRLLWVTPYKSFSVLLAEQFQNINMVIKTVVVGLLVQMCLLFITRYITENLLSEELCISMYCQVQQLVLDCSFSLLPALQLALLLYYSFGHSAVFAIPAVLPGFHLLLLCLCKRGSQYLNILGKFMWLMVIAMGGVMVFLYLQNEKDGTGLICVAGFIQALWVLAFSEVPAFHPNFGKKKFLFIFGSAGLVFVNSTALITELIAIAVNGKRLVGDLRRVVFPSEGLFTVILLLLSIFAPGKTESTGLQDAPQKSEDSNRTSNTRDPKDRRAP